MTAKTIDKVQKLHAMVPRLVKDPILESDINKSFNKSIDYLIKALPRKRGFLIVCCEDSKKSDIIFNKALGLNYFCFPVRNVSDIEGIVSNWSEESPYNILYIAHTISEEELEKIGKFSTPNKLSYLYLEITPKYVMDYKLKYETIVINKMKSPS